MLSKFNRLFLWFFLVINLIFLIGCAASHRDININLSLAIKDTEKIPLRAGLYLDPKMMNYTKETLGPASALFLHMGKALSEGAENITKKAFKETVIIYTKDSEVIPKGLDVIVIAEIEKIFDEPARRLPNLVKIKWTIQDIYGKVYYMNAFTGEAETKYGTTFSLIDRICEAYRKAIEEQFAKAYMGITSANWWESIKKETK